MRILFADKFPQTYLSEVVSLGHDCVVEPDLGADDLPGRMAGVDALVVRSTRVSAAAIAAADKLKLVIRAGAGTNTIDKDAAAARDIYVCNVPGKNAIAVAELTLGLILSIDRNIPDNVADLRNGNWDKKRYSEAKGLYGQTIGVVGTGAIGLAVAERASAFGLKVHVIEKAGRDEDTAARLNRLGVVYVADLPAMAQMCDILTFHVPAADSTKNLVDEDLLEVMKPGAMLINTSRGDVIDEAALIKALDEKGLRAGIDVYDGEPSSAMAEFNSALARHSRVYGTHHIGASTTQAQNAVAEGVVEILRSFVQGTVLFCVNLPT